MLRVTNLTCTRGGMAVLKDLSFDLAAGQALILRGPNGVGKTTLLRTLAGLQSPLSGTISCDTGALAYASHADGVKDALSVAENLAFWAAVYGRDVPPAVWDQFDLAALRDRTAGTLSAGQKRRLGLARLGVIGRDLLLLDEPTISLDGFSVRMFADWLENTHLAGGGAAVIATHIDLGIAGDTLELDPFRADPATPGGADEAFL